MAVSPSEAHYIIESCLTDFRIDGRTQLEHRPYTITNRSIKSKTNIPNNTNNKTAPSLILSNGSSRIHLPGSATDILCSVKADLVHPSPSKPNEGVLELGVDLSLCGGGGTVGGVAGGASNGGGAPKRRRQQREEESQITSLLQRLVLPHAVDYEKLVVWPGRYVWRLAIDIVVLRCDGCVLDAASIAVREALGNTMLPRVQAVMDGGDDTNGGGGGSGNGNNNNNNSSSKNDLMVDGDIQKAMPPAGAEDCPLVLTVSVLSAPPSAVADAVSQSGGSGTSSKKRHYRSISIIDARTEEEACASSRVCVSVDPHGMVCGVHTLGGGGGIMLEEGGEENGGGPSMPLAMLGEVVSSAAMACKNLYGLLDHKEEDGGKRNTGVAVVEDDGCGYGYLLKNHFLIQ
mmetsp:Transcript_38940/g.81460  ORF Transcript_38940/g.81460 Transcript_38940/m.81460 type:complete len:402 (+) Transcript_38940:109-1314(+)